MQFGLGYCRCRSSPSNDSERNDEHDGCHQRAKRVDGAKWEAGEIPQRSYSEGGNSITRLIESHQFSRHRGRESRKLLPTKTDAQREEGRTAKARQTESNDAASFTGGARDYLERHDQQDGQAGVDPAHRFPGGQSREENSPDGHHRPESRESEGGALSRHAPVLG